MRMSLEDVFLHLTTEDTAARRRPSCRTAEVPLSNVLAIAHKELKSYFASPIAYIVIGFFALMFGFFFYIALLVLRSSRACR